jgi:hypothetical protein
MVAALMDAARPRRGSSSSAVRTAPSVAGAAVVP